MLVVCFVWVAVLSSFGRCSPHVVGAARCNELGNDDIWWARSSVFGSAVVAVSPDAAACDVVCLYLAGSEFVGAKSELLATGCGFTGQR